MQIPEGALGEGRTDGWTGGRTGRCEFQVSKSILKMWTTKSICLMGLPDSRQAQPMSTHTQSLWGRVVGVALIRQITKVCGKVGAVALGNHNLNPIRQAQPLAQLLHLINSRLKCICSWAQGKEKAKTKLSWTELNWTRPGSSNLWPYICQNFSPWPTRVAF